MDILTKIIFEMSSMRYSYRDMVEACYDVYVNICEPSSLSKTEVVDKAIEVLGSI